MNAALLVLLAQAGRIADADFWNETNRREVSRQMYSRIFTAAGYYPATWPLYRLEMTPDSLVHKVTNTILKKAGIPSRTLASAGAPPPEHYLKGLQALLDAEEIGHLDLPYAVFCLKNRLRIGAGWLPDAAETLLTQSGDSRLLCLAGGVSV